MEQPTQPDKTYTEKDMRIRAIEDHLQHLTEKVDELSKKIDSLSECVNGLAPKLEQIRIDIATTKTDQGNLEKRVDRIDGKNDVWNVVNTSVAIIAGALGIGIK